MISVTAKRKQGVLCGFVVKGHAGFDVSGQDIICAAVSVLTINCSNSIEKFCLDEFTTRSDEGFLEFEITTQVTEEAQLLLSSLFLGLQGIEKDVGKKYLKVDY